MVIGLLLRQNRQSAADNVLSFGITSVLTVWVGMHRLVHAVTAMPPASEPAVKAIACGVRRGTDKERAK